METPYIRQSGLFRHHTMEPPVRIGLTPVAYKATAQPLSYGGKLSSRTQTGFSFARLMPQMSILYDSRLLKSECRAQYFLAWRYLSFAILYLHNSAICAIPINAIVCPNNYLAWMTFYMLNSLMKSVVHLSPPGAKSPLNCIDLVVPNTRRHLVSNTTDYQLPIGVWQHVYRASNSIGEFVCVETSSFSSGQ